MENEKRKKRGRLFYASLKQTSVLCTVLAVLALFGLIFYILADGVGKLNFQLLFGEYDPKAPSIFPAIIGTLRLILVAILLAVPLGVGCAVFLVEYSNGKGRFVRTVRVATETLAGIPSIVYGIFGYLFFVRALKMGYTLLGGGITLAVMILPVIVRSVEESLLAVPVGYREGAFALGTGKAATVFRVILPAASGGIVTAVILAVGRVLSESAVLILTVGQVVDTVPKSFLDGGTSLALDIYFLANHGYRDAAAACAVVLLLLVILMNLFATFLGKLIDRKKGT